MMLKIAMYMVITMVIRRFACQSIKTCWYFVPVVKWHVSCAHVCAVSSISSRLRLHHPLGHASAVAGRNFPRYNLIVTWTCSYFSLYIWFDNLLSVKILTTVTILCTVECRWGSYSRSRMYSSINDPGIGLLLLLATELQDIYIYICIWNLYFYDATTLHPLSSSLITHQLCNNYVYYLGVWSLHLWLTMSTVYHLEKALLNFSVVYDLQISFTRAMIYIMITDITNSVQNLPVPPVSTVKIFRLIYLLTTSEIMNAPEHRCFGNLSLKEHSALKDLKSDFNLILREADKEC